MPARVKGLGHVGLYVRDLEVMKEFWGGFMGMTLTKCNENIAFYSADPAAVDHEIAVMRGSRPAGGSAPRAADFAARRQAGRRA